MVDGAAVSTSGGFHNGGIFIFYGGELVIEDSVQYDEGDLQADSGYYPDAAAAESDRQPQSVSQSW